jgi:hypothetical protein
MITVRLSPEDLSRVRFAFSPLWETVASFRVLLDPGRHALHLPWVEQLEPHWRVVGFPRFLLFCCALPVSAESLRWEMLGSNQRPLLGESNTMVC